MTFIKDPLNATEPREIIEYSQDLEDRIEDEFDANKNQIEAVEQSITTLEQTVTALDTKLSVDYVVDFGSNQNGSWEKWFSGKLVQTKVVVVTRTETSTFVDYTWTFPFPFNDDKKIIYSGVFECIHQGVGYRYGKLLNHYSNNIAEKIFRGKDEDSNLFDNYRFRLKAEGTWK